MIKHGVAPFLECSSQGDARFSAVYARIRARGDKSIEEIYQAAKVFPNGRTGDDASVAKAFQDVARLYALLWEEYIAENPKFEAVLMQASGLSDHFGQPNHCCQATELWRIRHKLTYGEKAAQAYEVIAANQVKVGDIITFDTANSNVRIERISEAKCDGAVGLHANDETWSSYYQPEDRIRIAIEPIHPAIERERVRG